MLEENDVCVYHTYVYTHAGEGTGEKERGRKTYKLTERRVNEGERWRERLEN